MNNRYLYPVLFVVCAVGFMATAILTVQDHTAKAASVQQYTYGFYAYGLPTKTDKGVYVWLEADADSQKSVQDVIDTEDNPNLAEVFNLVGTFGWEFKSSDKQGPLTLYIFERPLSG